MRQNRDQIASVIRERICLDGGTGEMLLHEGELAQEFGVSRTPIRQVLQMLAYEGLVETRTGIGTIATPLVVEEYERDESVYRAILRAAAECACPVNVPAEVRTALLVASDDLENADELRDALFKAESSVLEAAHALIDDRILSAALRAAYWRHLRWLMREDNAHLEHRRKVLADRLRGAVSLSRSGNASDVVRHIAEVA